MITGTDRPRTPRPRDTGRAEVYRAEAAAGMDKDGPKLTLDECRAFAAHVCLNRYVSPPRVRDGRGHRRATGSAFTITLPRWSRTRWVVLHELAHSLNERSGSGQKAWHGPEWRALYLELLQDHLGWPVARRMGIEFDRAGLDY